MVPKAQDYIDIQTRSFYTILFNTIPNEFEQNRREGENGN